MTACILQGSEKHLVSDCGGEIFHPWIQEQLALVNTALQQQKIVRKIVNQYRYRNHQNPFTAHINEISLFVLKAIEGIHDRYLLLKTVQQDFENSVFSINMQSYIKSSLYNKNHASYMLIPFSSLQCSSLVGFMWPSVWSSFDLQVNKAILFIVM